MQLAQVNVATSLYDLSDPRMSGFVSKLDDINRLAENSPGFVWRLKSESADKAIDIQVTDDPRFIVNLSVWGSVEHLFDFAYKSDHRGIMVQRRSWFEKPSSAYMALWWVEDAHRPSVNEALARLAHLDQNGPTGFAFNFRRVFEPGQSASEPFGSGPHCVGWS